LSKGQQFSNECGENESLWCGKTSVVGKTGEEEVRERRQKGGGGRDSVDAPIALA
jgi:hypothetical protein